MTLPTNYYLYICVTLLNKLCKDFESITRTSVTHQYITHCHAHAIIVERSPMDTVIPYTTYIILGIFCYVFLVVNDNIRFDRADLQYL